MPDRPRRQDWQTLGVEPGADPGEVRRSYLERRALYAPDSVATYTLFEESEREAQLERIEDAYRRIMGSPAPQPQPLRIQEKLPAAPSGPPPPFEEDPGAHLRYHRLHKSLLLAEVANDIKVRAALLEKLEQEDFASLPAPVYVRGFVVQYARVLGLPNPDEIAAAYLGKLQAMIDEESAEQP